MHIGVNTGRDEIPPGRGATRGSRVRVNLCFSPDTYIYYVHIYVYVYRVNPIYTYICTYVYIYICIHTYLHIYVYAHPGLTRSTTRTGGTPLSV